MTESLADVEQAKATRRSPVAWFRASSFQYELILAALIVVVAVGVGIVSHGLFWRAANISQILVDVAITGVPAIAMTLVMITAGIDVSIGSLAGLAAAVVGVTFENGWPTSLAILMALVATTFGGLLNAFIITRGKVPPIITTLGTLSIWRAVVYALLGGSWISTIPPFLVNTLVLAKIGRYIPYAFLGAVLLVIVGAWASRTRPSFRGIFAIGNNEEAASIQGIPVRKLKFFLYTAMGLLAGVAGLLMLAQSPVVQPTAGTGFELQVIAAVVVGGTRIQGGKGSIIGSVLGAILVEVVQDAVIMFHIQSFWQSVVLGGMILVSVLIGMRGRRQE